MAMHSAVYHQQCAIAYSYTQPKHSCTALCRVNLRTRWGSTIIITTAWWSLYGCWMGSRRTHRVLLDLRCACIAHHQIQQYTREQLAQLLILFAANFLLDRADYKRFEWRMLNPYLKCFWITVVQIKCCKQSIAPHHHQSTTCRAPYHYKMWSRGRALHHSYKWSMCGTMHIKWVLSEFWILSAISFWLAFDIKKHSIPYESNKT